VDISENEELFTRIPQLFTALRLNSSTLTWWANYRRIDLEVSMAIVHIERPAELDSTAFETFMPPPVADLPRPTLGSVEAWVAPGGAVETGTWEATPGTFVRAIVDAEFCHFLSGHATFVTEGGRRFEFKAGDAAYFPPRTLGRWTIHKTLRKTYCIWR
jgi:uncharacterized cupin superfamily protein